MTPAEVFRSHGSKVANIIVHEGSQRAGSGTGFIVGGHLITCAHVMRRPPGYGVTVRFERPASGQTVEWSYPAFGSAPIVRGFSDEHSYDYAILEPPPNVVLGEGFRFSNNFPEVGEPVCCLGYPFDDPHLTLHQGHISAVYRSGVATMLKLDMSVNPSNSGGPLIRISDGAVLGVVARKATGLSAAFDQLMQSYDRNVRALAAAVGIFGVGDVDPVAVLVATQHQMKAVSAELARSANVGIGYAIHADPLSSEPSIVSDADACSPLG